MQTVFWLSKQDVEKVACYYQVIHDGVQDVFEKYCCDVLGEKVNTKQHLQL